MQRRPLMSRGEREEELALFHDMHKKEGDRKSNAVHPLMSNVHDEVAFVKLTGSSIPQHMASSAAATNIAALKSSKTGDDLLTADLGKNDYDWLLTPPGTPLMNPPDHISPAYGEDFLSHAVLPNLVRSLAAIKTSRLSSFKSEPIMKKEVSNGTLFSMRPDSGMRSGRNGMVRSNSTVAAGSSFTTSNVATSMAGRRTPAAPSSRPTSRPTTPTKRSTTTSTPASRPTTPTSRPRVPASTPMPRPETPTSRSRAAPTPLSRPSTPSGRATVTAFSRNTENNVMPSSLTSKGSVPSRPTTPLRRPIAPQAQPQSSSATATRSSSVTKQRPAPSRSNPSSRGSSPTIKPNAWQQLSDIPGFSLEPPPNLRTSLPSRPSSNSRGASVSTSRPAPSNGVATSLRVNSGMQAEKAQDVSARRPSSPIVARGRSGTLSSFTGERQNSIGAPVMRNGGRFDRNPSESVVKGTKVVDKMMPSRKPFPSSLSPESALSVSQVKHAVRPGTPTAIKDSAGFGRSTPRKSAELSMRHMELRQSTTSGLRSLMRNTPTASIYGVRSAGMRGLTNSSPMATSSNASSDYSMGIVRDPEGSEVGEEFTTSEAGSKASPASQSDSLTSVVKNTHMHSWLGSPEYKDGTPESITHSTPEANQDLQQNPENLASSESCLVCRHGCVPANCDLCNMKIRLQKLNEKCRASLRASLHVSEKPQIQSSGNGRL